MTGRDANTGRSTSGALLIAALRLLPKNAISRLAGRVVSLRLPALLQRWQIRGFARVFGVDWSEVRDPITSFRSLQDFFVRAFLPEARPVDTDPAAFFSPCDGAWGEAGIVKEGMLLQVKGRPYSHGALLGDDASAERFEGGSYATFYLSPCDYHRFHAPCDVHIARLRYLPGTLWPVNRAGVEGVDALFAQNERICAFMDPPAPGGQGALCIVAVGATLVGKVRVTFDSLSSNLPGAAVQERTYGEEAPRLKKGEEWGRFEFGSTLVVIAAPGVAELDEHESGTSVRMGARIGSLRREHGST
ncbi:MAG: phosphatidylserine decarboxylase [Deltaproteobacteria bacterium]|nr:phosphatidylserine decarboxylase [Deltaproteobacteria bacterium]